MRDPDEIQEIKRKADTALILLEGLVNYLRTLNIIDVEDFNQFLEENQISTGPTFRKQTN